MSVCEECRADPTQNHACEFCKRYYCDRHWLNHLAWEKHHEGLAKEMAKLWRKRPEAGGLTAPD